MSTITKKNTITYDRTPSSSAIQSQRGLSNINSSPYLTLARCLLVLEEPMHSAFGK